jgi:hypothetical protein
MLVFKTHHRVKKKKTPEVFQVDCGCSILHMTTGVTQDVPKKNSGTFTWIRLTKICDHLSQNKCKSIRALSIFFQGIHLKVVASLQVSYTYFSSLNWAYETYVHALGLALTQLSELLTAQLPNEKTATVSSSLPPLFVEQVSGTNIAVTTENLRVMTSPANPQTAR